MLDLFPGDIHLWYVFPDEITNNTILDTYENLLTPAEREQQQRFHFKRHRRQYLVTRALVRVTLSRYTDVAPRHWKFTKNEYGKPEIEPMAGVPRIRFNLSHTDGLIVCALFLHGDIGVDVEDCKRDRTLIDVADRYFSAQEVSDLHKHPQWMLQQRFFEYWTLKEAFVKAKGMGLSLPLDRFTFHLSPNHPLRISFDREQNESPDNWLFWSLKPSSRHISAVCVQREDDVSYKLSVKKTIPLLMDGEPFSCELLDSSEPNSVFLR